MGTITKGFIKDWNGNKMLPITRGELVLDVEGNVALTSSLFLAGTFKDAQGKGLPGLITAAERAMLNGASGQNIVDLYSKLEHINAGLSFGGTHQGGTVPVGSARSLCGCSHFPALAEGLQVEDMETPGHWFCLHPGVCRTDVREPRRAHQSGAVPPGHSPTRMCLLHSVQQSHVGLARVRARTLRVLHGTIRLQHHPHVSGWSGRLWFLYQHLLALPQRQHGTLRLAPHPYGTGHDYV